MQLQQVVQYHAISYVDEGTVHLQQSALAFLKVNAYKHKEPVFKDDVHLCYVAASESDDNCYNGLLR